MSTPLTAEHLDLCYRLHERLVATGSEHFDMNVWLANDEREIAGIPYVEGLNSLLGVDPKVIHECGTVACIAGHTMLLLTDDEQAEVSTSMKPWYQHHGLALALAERLGMAVDLPTNRLPGDMFISDWPAYMRTFRQARYARYCTTSTTTTTEAWARAEYDTIVWVLDDLIHGVRQNWWDGQILTAEEEMELAQEELRQQLEDERDDEDDRF